MFDTTNKNKLIEVIRSERDSGSHDESIIADLFFRGASLGLIYQAFREMDAGPPRSLMKKVLAATKGHRYDPTHREDVQPGFCNRCGAEVLVAIPGSLSQKELGDFLEAAPALHAPDFLVYGKYWIHPGGHCPNGCSVALFDFGSRGLFDRLEQERQRRETAAIVVTQKDPKGELRERLKIYLDRYIMVTAPYDNDLKPDYGEYITLEPGTHTLIVRDYEVNRPDRRESNLIEFTIANDEQVEFEVGETEFSLILSRLER